MKIRFILLSFVMILANTSLLAEEGGAGHYVPGSIASFIDGIPADEAFVSRLNLVYYRGSLDVGQPLPVANLLAVNVNAESFATGLSLLWRPPIEFGDDLSIAISVTIPYVWMSVDGSVEAMLPDGTTGFVPRSENRSGVGDIILMPFLINYNVNENLNTNFRFGIYTPTGEYEVGRLANTGKNYWTFEPVFGAIYLNQDNGIEASLFASMDFNTENAATNYHTGNQLHVEMTVAQHFGLAGGACGIGISGFWYEQVSGDSKSGARLGWFKGQTAGLGPVLSFIGKIANVDVAGEMKWLPELETRRRLEGDYVWLKLVVKV